LIIAVCILLRKFIKMKLIAIFLFLLTSQIVLAQFDNPSNNSVQFEQNENNTATPNGFELPATKKPNISIKENKYNTNTLPKLEVKKEEFDMSKEDGLLENKTNKAPKYFTMDKEAKEEYGRDYVLADFKTKTSYVNIVYRDHESVDGDRIRVYVNDDVVQSEILLDGNFRGFDLTLEVGYNKIDFEALNQGDSGPNTAQLHVYDDKGVLISAHEWNLLTGNKASVIIIKE